MAVYGTDKMGWSQTMRMAHRCASSGEYENGAKYYRDALREGTNDTLIYNNMADLCMNAGQLDQAIAYAEQAVVRSPNEAVPHVTLAEIYQAKGEHEKAVDWILKAQEVFEESVPELKNVEFDSIEQVIKQLPARVKLQVASKDWIRIIYLVNSLRRNYEMERDYIRRGVSWKFLLGIRRKSLGSVARKYMWAKEKLGVKGDGPVAIASTYGAMSAIIGSPRVKVLEKGPEDSTIEMSACWQYSVIRNLGLDNDPGWVSCSCMCTEQLNSIAKAINPTVNFEFASTIPDGDRSCKGTFSIRNNVQIMKYREDNRIVAAPESEKFGL